MRLQTSPGCGSEAHRDLVESVTLDLLTGLVEVGDVSALLLGG